MTQKIKCIENPELIESLLQPENLSALEHLLEENSKELKRLKKLKRKGEIDFGKSFVESDIIEVFPKVMQDVDLFLGSDDVSVPACRYFTLLDAIYSYVPIHCPAYDYQFKMVEMRKLRKIQSIIALSHEYTHHVQGERMLFDGKMSSMFKEGHAMGVHTHMAKNYSEQEGNEAFLLYIHDLSVKQLKKTYNWMCKTKGEAEIQSLLKNVSSGKENKLSHLLFSREPTSHALGNTIFSIAELKHGPKIYKETLNGNFNYLIS